MLASLVRTAALLLLVSTAAAHEIGPLVTPPPALRSPQGIPAIVDGDELPLVITLDYAIVDGRRVLFVPATGRIVYVLVP
jgi:hypothetical protein